MSAPAALSPKTRPPLIISEDDLNWLLQPIEALELTRNKRRALTDPSGSRPGKPVTRIIHLLSLSAEALQGDGYPGFGKNATGKIADILRTRNPQFQLAAFKEDSPTLPATLFDVRTPAALRTRLADGNLVLITDQNSEQAPPSFLISNDDLDWLLQPIEKFGLTGDQTRALKDPDYGRSPGKPVTKIIHLLSLSREALQKDYPGFGNTAMNAAAHILRTRNPQFQLAAFKEDSPTLPATLLDVTRPEALRTRLVDAGLVENTDAGTAASAATALAEAAAPKQTLKFPIDLTRKQSEALGRKIEALELDADLTYKLQNPRKPSPAIENIVHLLLTLEGELLSYRFPGIGGDELATIRSKLTEYCTKYKLPAFDIAQKPDEIDTDAARYRATKDPFLGQDVGYAIRIITEDEATIRANSAAKTFRFPLRLSEEELDKLLQDISVLDQTSRVTNSLRGHNGAEPPITLLVHFLTCCKNDFKARVFDGIGPNITAQMEAKLKAIDTRFVIADTEEEIPLPIEYRDIDDPDALKQKLIDDGLVELKGARPRVAPAYEKAAARPASTQSPAPQTDFAASNAAGRYDGRRLRAARLISGGNQKTRARNVKKGGGGQPNRRPSPGRSGPR